MRSSCSAFGASGLAAAFLLDCRDGDGQPMTGRVADFGINAGLIAGAANLINLFDLRPGRAIKVSLLASAALAATGPRARASVAAPAGAALALLPEDLGERAMLGDSGANAIGAMLGVAAASSLPRPARLGVLAGVVGLTVASEKVSFTKVIARTRAVNWLDMLGRRPAGPGARSGRGARGPPGGRRAARPARFLAWSVTAPGSVRAAGSARTPRADEPVGEQAAETGAVSRAAGIGRAALLIGGLTVVARILGFARTLVFSGTVKASCLGTAYLTANLVPNVIYDIVLGGALTAIVVPVLAGPAERAAGEETARRERDAISSALLTWTVVILVPVSLAVALVAEPAISALMPANPAPHCSSASLVPIAARMLAVFAPQILLYGLAVVCYGILQSHRKFTAPALAPILSSLVVIAAYVLFVPLGRHIYDLRARLADLGRADALRRNHARRRGARADGHRPGLAAPAPVAPDAAVPARDRPASQEPGRGRRRRADRAGRERARRHQAGQRARNGQ